MSGLVFFYLFVSVSYGLLSILFLLQWQMFKQRQTDLSLGVILAISAVSYFLYSLEKENMPILISGYIIDFITAVLCIVTFAKMATSLYKKLSIARVPHKKMSNKKCLCEAESKSIEIKKNKYKIIIDKAKSF